MEGYGVRGGYSRAMYLLRIPPQIKVLEAAGALADGRVEVDRKGSTIIARVKSSEGDKTYKVIVKRVLDGYLVYSDDNGTKYRKYVGYPIISVLMLVGVLPRDKEIEEALKGIPWRKLNEGYKRYSLVEEVVTNMVKGKVSPEKLKVFKVNILNELRKLRLYYNQELNSK